MEIIPSSPRLEINHALDMLDLIGEVVVLVQSESGSESGNDTPMPDTDIEIEPLTPLIDEHMPPVEIDSHTMHQMPVAFDPVTFPVDRIAEWLKHISIPDENEIETEPHSDTLDETQEVFTSMDETQELVTAMDPESVSVLETCTQLLSKIEEVRLAVLHLQYSLRSETVGTHGSRSQNRAQRLWSWGHAGVFLAELPCL